MSRNHARRQIDYNRSLILMDNIAEFCEQDNPDMYEPSANGTTSVDKKRPGTDNRAEQVGNKKKENIIIPIVKKIEDPLAAIEEKVTKRRKVQGHFIRMSYCVQVPNPDDYEYTDKDLEFLKDLNERLQKNVKGAPVIAPEVFEKIITQWEHETGKEEAIQLSKALLIAETIYTTPAKEYLSEIYTYWIKLREKYKRPMVRKYLKAVNKDDQNPNAAFRTRENPKMRTRRAQKAND